MARPARAAASKASPQITKAVKGKGKTAAKKEESDVSDAESEPATSSSSSSSDEETGGRDDYKEPDSDAIDEDSDDDDADVNEEEASTDPDDEELSVVEEDSNGEEVIDFSTSKGSSSKKRKGKAAESAASTPSKKAKNNKKASGSAKKKEEEDGSDFDENQDEDEDEDEDEEVDMGDGRKITKTKLVKAPSTSVKPGIIDPHTMKFLSDMIANNEREWFAKNDARYRHAHQNWVDFVTAVQPDIQRGDWSVPELPAKDLIHRIYRDVRFSNDKTPYKKSFSASFSRAGRKGPFAGYYLQISPNGRSLLAGGKWGPDKNDLSTIRSHILRSSKPLRKVLNAPEFVKHFGPAKVDGKGKGKRCSVFGAEDALKIAPKIQGVDKTHKDIDLLKLRTIGVVYDFKDEEVLSKDFMKRVGDVVAAMSPLVLLINDMLHPTSDNEGEEDGGNSTPEEVAHADEAEEEEDEESDAGGGIEAA